MVGQLGGSVAPVVVMWGHENTLAERYHRLSNGIVEFPPPSYLNNEDGYTLQTRKQTADTTFAGCSRPSFDHVLDCNL